MSYRLSVVCCKLLLIQYIWKCLATVFTAVIEFSFINTLFCPSHFGSQAVFVNLNFEVLFLFHTVVHVNLLC